MSSAEQREPIPFGTYLLVQRLSIGGSFEVWRATAPGVGGHKRLVAIKRLLPFLAEDSSFIAMLMDEARLALRLNHPNIAQHFDMGRIDESCFIAMEYVSGMDLGTVIRGGRKKVGLVPVALGCHVVAQCCHGLEYAHGLTNENGRELGIVHREVSPQNVLIGYDGDVKVIEWTGRAAGRDQRVGSIRSRILYTSPEQVQGKQLDRRSDVFQLGLCLYELLSGVRLFVADTDYATLQKVLDGVVEPPSKQNAAIPEALEKVVLKALAKEPDARYPNARELADALKPFSSGRAELSRFMKATFAEDYEQEQIRLQLLGFSSAEPVEEAPAPSEVVLDLVTQLERKWHV